jgi:hypothetical protein
MLHFIQLELNHSHDFRSQSSPCHTDHPRLPGTDNQQLMEKKQFVSKGNPSKVFLQPHSAFKGIAEESGLGSQLGRMKKGKGFGGGIAVLLLHPMVEIWAIVMLQFAINLGDASLNNRVFIHRNVGKPAGAGSPNSNQILSYR